MRSPLLAIARKEFIQIRRDKATIYMVFIFPLMMLILYGFGIRYDVKSVPMTILDQDHSTDSRQYIERFLQLDLLSNRAPRRELRSAAGRHRSRTRTYWHGDPTELRRAHLVQSRGHGPGYRRRFGQQHGDDLARLLHLDHQGVLLLHHAEPDGVADPPHEL